jgi:putative spermidine/putrescine transport system ATP-binding protein
LGKREDASYMQKSNDSELRDVATSGQALRLSKITHRYGNALAVDGVDLDVRGGELVALLGPSGCGKTTLLRAIGGFIRQTEGQIQIGGEVVDELPPNQRSVGIVFQNYALFPHMTAAQNIAYGLEARGRRRIEIVARVDEMLALVKLQSFATRYPREMSGGQQQRVALARALAVRPAVLLLDEPFAALDKNLRLDMQIEIKRIQRLAGTTTLIVTHDQEEALSMAERVAVFQQGRLEQFGTPAEIYDAPQSLFVNTFVGAANTLEGVVQAVREGSVAVRLAAGAVIEARALSTSKPAAGDRVVVCLRPEQIRITNDPGGITGTVEMGLPLGSVIVHEVRLADNRPIKISQPRDTGAEPLAPGTVISMAAASPRAATAFRAN